MVIEGLSGGGGGSVGTRTVTSLVVDEIELPPRFTSSSTKYRTNPLHQAR